MPLRLQTRDPSLLLHHIKLEAETLAIVKGLRIARRRRHHTNDPVSAVTRDVLAKKRYLPGDDWHAVRRKLLTASDMAACLGQNRYCSPTTLFKRKTLQGFVFKGNEATRWGQKYEPEAAAVYSALTGMRLADEEIGLVVSDYEKPGDKGRKRYGGTPDFMTKSGVMVEIKCPYTRKITHEMPACYMAQVMFQMEVCGAHTAHFVQYYPPSDDAINNDCVSNGELDIVIVKRDPTWWPSVVPVLDKFWDRVIAWYEARDLELGDRPARSNDRLASTTTATHNDTRVRLYPGVFDMAKYSR